MEIKARKRIAVHYQCPECGAQTFQTCLTATKKNLEQRPQCSSSSCGLKYGFGEEPEMQVKVRRYYTMFAEETDLNGTKRAGTLGEIGERFTVCQIVQPNIRAFRAWVEKRRAERAEENRTYQEEMSKRQAEAEEQRKKEEAERALFKEAQEVARVAWVDALDGAATTTDEADWDGWEALDEHPF